MKRLFELILMMVSFAIGADVKPFFFENVATDSISQQNEFEYMLKYKLFGRDYLKMGRRVIIPDKSGWNGSANDITSYEGISLGGATLAGGNIALGDGCKLTTGPIRAISFTAGNDNGQHEFGGHICLENNAISTSVSTGISRAGGELSCENVHEAPINLSIPTTTWPDSGYIDDIIISENNGVSYIEVPDGKGTYDVYVNNISTGVGGTNGAKVYIRMPDGGRLTRIFVKNLSIGNHTTFSVVYRTEEGDEIQSQSQYRGNVMFYSNNDITFDNTDNVPIQGSFITTGKIYLKCNLDFAGQLLANQLEIGNDFKGENFRFVPFDPPIIDIPELDKDGGLRENDSTVIIPLTLDTAGSVDVFFSYCFDLKNDVDSSDFNVDSTDFPVCGISTKTVVIPEGNLTPSEPIKINIKIDTLIEPSEYLVLKINIESGAVLPNNKTDGELKIKIVDATTRSPLAFDTIAVYSFNENKIGLVDNIKVLNKTDFTKFVLDSCYTGRYRLDSLTGELSLIANPLDYEMTRIDTIKVTLKDTGNVSISRYIPISVIDVNEAPSINDTTFVILENIPIPSFVGKLNLIDVDVNSEFRHNLFKIIEGDTSKFTINSFGQITTKKIFDYEIDDSVYVLKVIAYDKNDVKLCDTAIIAINIGNTNEMPKFSTKDTTLYIDENKSLAIIGNVAAIDEDGDTITYKIIESVPFNVDSLGNIKSTREFDYEKEKNFSFKVVATSKGNLSDTIYVKIVVNNINEPVHVDDAKFNISENYTGPVGKVEGKDDDGEHVKYSVRDSNVYSIDSIGNIRIIKPLDYETQKNDTLVVYVSTLNPKDSIDYDTAIVVINVVNVNEPPKLLPNDTLSVPENCKNCEVGKVVAIDPDKDAITYIIKEPGFIIDTNGIIKVTNHFDYEKTPVVTITVIAKDTSGASDTSTYKIKVTDVNEPVHTKDTTCSVKENYTGNVCKIVGTDEDNTKPTFIVTDTTNYKIDSTGQLVIIKPIDYEKKTKDTIKVIVTDGTFYDTSKVIIKVIDEDEIPNITIIDDKPPADTIKTNDPDHKIEYKICENTKCEYDSISTHIIKDTTIKVCNTNKTFCDSVVFLFNDVPPLVILTNVKSTDAYIDYITIEEEIKDDKIYVNKKDNKIIVTVKDTVHKKETKFDIDVKLDTIPTKDIKIKEYNYLIDESNATYKAIGNNLVEVSEVIKTEDGNKIVVTKVIDNDGKDVDTVQTITYTQKVNGKEVVVTYKIDNLSGQRIGDYDVSYMIDSCTKVTYKVNDKNQIVKNKEGNIGYTITYDYTDEYGNKATSSIDIVYDDIAPKVEIISPTKSEHFNTNAINVKWTINGEIQNTLNIQRLEKGVNWVIRRYVDKAGNVSADTVMVFMNEAKDIDITIINPITEINQDKVDEYYSSENKYDINKPYKVTAVDPKDNKLPETIGVGFIVNIALPSINSTGNVSTLSDIIKNDKVPVDDKGNVVGASNLSIPVEEYINENCTDDFRQDYHKNGTNIPLYNVKYNLHLWMYTSNANYVNDFEINYDIDSKTEANAASIAKFVIDWIPEKDGNVKAKNQKSLGTGAYLVKLYSKSTAIYRCGFKKQKAGDKIIKKEYNLKSFGYKRPNK